MTCIRIIHSPTVRLVGRQVIDQVQLDDFLEDEGAEFWETDTDVASQALVEVAGRLCYKSYAKPRPGGNSAYIGHILEVGHGSVIEHAVFNFIITGVSRSFTHELVRHRAGWAYSQRSQRFCDETQGAFVEPKIIEDDPELHASWLSSVQKSLDVYRLISDKLAHRMMVEGYENHKRLCESSGSASPGFPGWKLHLTSEEKTSYRKRARESARSVLPNATETQIFVTANARALRHFIESRGDEHADAEIRSVALAILDILRMEAPGFVADYRDEDRPGVGRISSTPHSKV